MQMREKILLVAIPYVIAIYLWFSLASPAFVSGQDKNTELEGKRTEQQELKAKLTSMVALQKEKATLESQIQDLRGSVPKEPELDILVIDLEKIALASGLDVLGVVPPEKDKEKLAEEASEEGSMIEDIKASQKAAGQTAADVRDRIKNPLGQPGRPGQGGKGQGASDVDLGLSKLVKEVSLVGNYPQFVEFMRRMESYQRVISIDQVEFELPAEMGSKKKESIKFPTISFLMSAYYLP